MDKGGKSEGKTAKYQTTLPNTRNNNQDNETS